MKVLMVNGSPNKDGVIFTALSAIAEQLKKEGVDSEIYQIGKDDDSLTIAQAANEITEKMKESDGLIIGSPDYFASPTGKLLAVLDRAYLNTTPFAYKPAASIASGRRTGLSATLDVLNQYFLMSNQPVIPGNYYNGIHGGTAGEAVQDTEGMQTMRALARNMAWMLNALDAAKKAGVVIPEQEKKIKYSVVH